jgi:hypothetical protein
MFIFGQKQGKYLILAENNVYFSPKVGNKISFGGIAAYM